MANLSFTNALRRIEQNIPPIWLMRQAGRYHSHYQKLKQKYRFQELCKNPELAAQTAYGPVKEFDFDVAILFSDILFPLDAFGMKLEYNPGPILDEYLNETIYSNLRSTEDAVDGLFFQGEALKETRRILPQNKSLIGFIGGPWTLFSYASGLHLEKEDCVSTLPVLSQKLFEEKLIPLLLSNIKIQLDGGAEIIMIFDSSVSQLKKDAFQNEYCPYLYTLFSSFPQKLGYYAKRQYSILDKINELYQKGMAGIGIDSSYSLDVFLKSQKQGFIQGNFNENFISLPTKEFQKELTKYLTELQNVPKSDRRGWICGLGHGVTPSTPEQNVHIFVERVRAFFSES